MCHVIVLQPTFAGLVATRTVYGVMKKQEFHRIADSLVNALCIGADLHVIGNRRGARGEKLWRAFNFHETHPATAFDTDVGMIAVTRDLDADIVRYLNNGLS